MTIELTDAKRQQAIGSLQRYFKENMDEPIGNLSAGALLDFFLAEVAPLAYNKAVADVQQHLQQRVMDVDVEVYADEFLYWSAIDKKRRGK